MLISLQRLCLVIVFVVLGLPVSGQTVSTLVTGPSSFDDGLSLDAQGNLYASYYYGGVVSKITPAGGVSVFASGLTRPNGSTMDEAGNLYVAESGANRIMRYTPGGVSSVHLAGITNPTGLVFDLDGNLLIAQYQLSRISKMDTTGVVTTFMTAGGLNGPVGLQMDSAGNLYIGNFTNGYVLKRTPAGVVSVIANLPGYLGFITLAGDAIYATAFQDNRIYRAPIDGSGKTIFAGTGVAGQLDGDIATASFNGPNGIVASPDGTTLYVSDFQSRSIRVISGLPQVSAVAQPVAPQPKPLLRNHPNPFNPATTLSYKLSSNSRVSLRVYNARGRQVADLVDAHQSAGKHDVKFSGEGLASGIYFSRLTIDGNVVTTKMVLAK